MHGFGVSGGTGGVLKGEGASETTAPKCTKVKKAALTQHETAYALGLLTLWRSMPQEVLAHTSEFGDSGPTPDGRDGCVWGCVWGPTPSTVTTKT